MSSTKPPIDTYLAARTAEMLALPQRICKRRYCRRRNACHWHFRATGEPCCLANLDAAQRRCFDALYDQARRIRDHGGYNGLVFASRDPQRRALEDAGVEIARAAIPKHHRRHFDAFRRARDTLPPPDEAE